jgi:aconitase (EC 4.2.1.3)
VRIYLTFSGLGNDQQGNPVYLKDIWPSSQEIAEAVAQVSTSMFHKEYAEVFAGDEQWQAIEVPHAATYVWHQDSTYIQHPPFFDDIAGPLPVIEDVKGANVLALLGDSVTTDHISPAGNIKADSPAGRYLREQGVEPRDFNSYGSRRGNHEVMMRGTFANIRIRNEMLGGEQGGNTLYIPTGEKMAIYDAAMKYQASGTPLVVIAGQEYGTGSSRDWAAKGTYLLGIKAVLAESYERIHRSNLVGMGVLPLEFLPGENRETLGLTGYEVYDILGLTDLYPRKRVDVVARREDGSEVRFQAIARLDTPVEVDYYKNGGILQTVLLNMLNEARAQ